MLWDSELDKLEVTSSDDDFAGSKGSTAVDSILLFKDSNVLSEANDVTTPTGVEDSIDSFSVESIFDCGSELINNSFFSLSNSSFWSDEVDISAFLTGWCVGTSSSSSSDGFSGVRKSKSSCSSRGLSRELIGSELPSTSGSVEDWSSVALHISERTFDFSKSSKIANVSKTSSPCILFLSASELHDSSCGFVMVNVFELWAREVFFSTMELFELLSLNGWKRLLPFLLLIFVCEWGWTAAILSPSKGSGSNIDPWYSGCKWLVFCRDDLRKPEFWFEQVLEDIFWRELFVLSGWFWKEEGIGLERDSAKVDLLIFDESLIRDCIEADVDDLDADSAVDGCSWTMGWVEGTPNCISNNDDKLAGGWSNEAANEGELSNFKAGAARGVGFNWDWWCLLAAPTPGLTLFSGEVCFCPMRLWSTLKIFSRLSCLSSSFLSDELWLFKLGGSFAGLPENKL